MTHHFGSILRRIYKPSKKFFIKSPYPYLSKCTDPLNKMSQLLNEKLLKVNRPPGQPQCRVIVEGQFQGDRTAVKMVFEIC